MNSQSCQAVPTAHQLLRLQPGRLPFSLPDPSQSSSLLESSEASGAGLELWELELASSEEEEGEGSLLAFATCASGSERDGTPPVSA